MMEHLNDGVLQSLLDRELDEESRRTSREHLAVCPPCRSRLGDVRDANSIFSMAIGHLDLAADGGGRMASFTPPSTAKRPSWRRLPSLRAAAMVLVFAAGASATLPGSPIRRWFVDSPPEQPAAMVAAAREAPVAIEEMVDEAGVSVAPEDGDVRVSLSQLAGPVRIEARLVNTPRAAAFASADSEVRFRTGTGSIEILAAEGSIRIDIPRSSARAIIQLDGRTVASKDGEILKMTSDPAGVGAPEISFELQP